MTEQVPPERELDIAVSTDDLNLVDWMRPYVLKTGGLLRGLLVLLILICSIWLGIWLWVALTYFAGLLLLFVSAWLVTLILAPVVSKLIEWGIAKGLAIGLCYLLLIAFVGLFVALIAPGLILQTKSLIQNFGPFTDNVQSWLNSTMGSLGLGKLDLSEIIKQFESYATTLLKNALDLVTGVAGFLFQILLVTIISASLLAGRRFSANEKPRSASTLEKTVPLRWRQFARWLRLTVERNFGIFLGGQLIVSAFYAVAVGLVMWVSGLPYAVTTACLCGVFMLIPLFGGPISLFIPLIVAISSEPVSALIVLPILFIIQTALLNVVLPKIVGKGSGLGPVSTLFVLLAGGQIGGIWGVILGVPLAGVAVSTFDYVMSHILTREAKSPDAVVSVTTTSDPNNSVEVGVNIVKGQPAEQISKS